MTPARNDEFSSGLGPANDHALIEPTVEPLFSENFWFFGYDPASKFGHLLHVSAVPDKYDLRQETVLLYLPGGDDFLYAFGEGRHCSAARPCASNLAFQCLEPFRRWRITYDATAHGFTAKEMLAGTVGYGPRSRVNFDFEIECVTPAWVAGHALGASERTLKRHVESSAPGARGFSLHYEQLYRVRGSLGIDGRRFEIGGTGIRDHSRGPRDFGHFGFHQLITSVFPSGRAFGLLRVFNRAGDELMNDAYVVDHGRLRPAKVLEATPLTDLQLKGARIVVGLDLGNGEQVRIEGEQETAAVLQMAAPNNAIPGFSRGADPRWGALLTEGCVRWTWDGETGYGQAERSSPPDSLQQAAGGRPKS